MIGKLVTNSACMLTSYIADNMSTAEIIFFLLLLSLCLGRSPTPVKNLLLSDYPYRNYQPYRALCRVFDPGCPCRLRVQAVKDRFKERWLFVPLTRSVGPFGGRVRPACKVSVKLCCTADEDIGLLNITRG